LTVNLTVTGISLDKVHHAFPWIQAWGTVNPIFNR